MKLEEITARKKIGAGRSAQVFHVQESTGQELAIKVFTGEEGIAKFVNYIFTGGPLIYGWNSDAHSATLYRRSILNNLVEYWFGDRLRVPNAKGFNWNEEHQAYELYNEFSKGRHVALHHPFSADRESELDDLVNNIMKPLVKRLYKAGLDGMLWQAGYGHPVGLGNFMLDKIIDDENHWIWIDIESGIPAIAAPSLSALSNFYIPKAIEYRHILFDDVNTTKLESYITSNKLAIEQKLSPDRYVDILDKIQLLKLAQHRINSLKRIERSVLPKKIKGKITQSEADFYIRHPLRWYFKEVLKMPKKSFMKIGDLTWDIYNKVTFKLMDKEFWKKTKKAIQSQDYRTEIVRIQIDKRIQAWEKRKMLKSQEGEYLRRQLNQEETSQYFTDLFVMGALKVADWTVIPLVVGGLVATNYVDPLAGVAMVALAGSFTRTGYTASKFVLDLIKPSNLKKFPSTVKKIKQASYESCLQLGINGYKAGLKSVYSNTQAGIKSVLGTKHLIALSTSWIPEWGTLCYVAQMAYSEFTTDSDVGKFLLYDGFTEIGKKLPAYGGPNTRTEHFFNHIPDLVIRKR